MAKKSKTSTDIMDTLLSSTDNKYARVVAEGTVSDIKGYINTGCYILNAQISGDLFKGIPLNRTTVLSGERGTGKSFIALSLAKQFLLDNKDGIVVYWRTEDDIDKTFITNRGIDIDRFIDMPVATIEEFKTQSFNMVNKLQEEHENGVVHPPILWVLDSLGNVTSSKERDDTLSGSDKRDMTKQQAIRSTFRLLNNPLSILGIGFIVTAHVYAKIGSYIPGNEIAGGGGLQYAASVITELSKAKHREGTEQVGSIISSRLQKNRLAKEGTKIKMLLSFKNGLHPYYGLAELCIDAGIWKKSGNRIEIEDGTKKYEKEIYKNSKKYFTDELMEKLNEYVNDVFKFGNKDEFEDDTFLDDPSDEVDDNEESGE